MDESDWKSGGERKAAVERTYPAQSLQYELYPLGEQAVVIRWDGEISEPMLDVVSAAVRCLEHDPGPAVVEFVRAYRTVTVYYDPVALYIDKQAYREETASSHSSVEGGESKRDVSLAGKEPSPYELMCSWIRGRLKLLDVTISKMENEGRQALRVVPVCFGGAFGPDLQALSAQAGIMEKETIERYCSVVYTVYMVGFTNGFPYMGGLHESLAMPRRAHPRQLVPEGTVGIAGMQTGIYPVASPGGWQLIGRTPLRLFDPWRARPSLFQAGDRVRFRPISEAQFAALEGAPSDGDSWERFVEQEDAR